MKTAWNGATAPHYTHRNGADSGECRCPTCRRTVSRDELIEIRVRQDEFVAEIREQARAEFGRERDAEIERIQQQAVVAVDLAEREGAKKAVAARREAKAAAKAEFEGALKRQVEAIVEKAAQEKDRAVSAANEKHAAETQRLIEKNKEMERLLEKKTANELGEVGESDLHDVLIAEFPADQITRVAKGVNGPDIVQRVFDGGGVFTDRAIIYESKNHKAYQSKWATKAREDQINADADHVVIVTTAFPPGKSHLMVDNGVIVCSPAQVVAVAHMLRRSVLQTHALGLSNADRDEKTAKLYELMTSDRSTERWERLSSATSALVEIETADAAHQQRARNKRLSHVRDIMAVHDEFGGDIAAILRGEPEDLL